MFIDQPCPRRLQIVQMAFKAMSKKVYSRQSKIQYRPCGLYYPLGGLKLSKMVPGALRPDLATIS